VINGTSKTSFDPLFFITSARGQIGRVNQTDGFVPQRSDVQDLLHQIVIDRAQAPDTHPHSELVQHPHVRHLSVVAQMRKTAESTLLAQRALQRIEAAATTQRAQQMRTPQLRRAKGESGTPSSSRNGPARIDKIVRNEVS
jgi:hypothetical protein